MPKPARRGKSRVRWDVVRILATAGGIQPLIVAHHRAGFRPPLTYSAVASWKARQTLPADRLAEVLLTLESLSGPLAFRDFIVNDR